MDKILGFVIWLLVEERHGHPDLDALVKFRKLAVVFSAAFLIFTLIDFSVGQNNFVADQNAFLINRFFHLDIFNFGSIIKLFMSGAVIFYWSMVLFFDVKIRMAIHFNSKNK